MNSSREKWWAQVLLAYAVSSVIPEVVAEEKSILEGADVIGNNVATRFYEHNSLISDSFGSFGNIEDLTVSTSREFIIELPRTETIKVVYLSPYQFPNRNRSKHRVG